MIHYEKHVHKPLLQTQINKSQGRFTDLSDFSSSEVPYFNKSIHRSSDQILAIGREARTLNMRLLTKLQKNKTKKRWETNSSFVTVEDRSWSVYLDVSGQLCGESLLLYILHSCFTSEQINGHTRRQKTLMLLPLQRLQREKQTITIKYSNTNYSFKCNSQISVW